VRIDQLVTFRCVADERSYTRAAERLSLSQPAVYQQVRQLELELREKLFYVVGKAVLVTAAGRELYTFAASVDQAHQTLLQALERVGDRDRQVIRIGATAYFGILPLAADRIASRFPGSVVQFRSMHPGETIELIRAGEVDFGFFGPAFSSVDLAADLLLSQRIVVAAPAGHELASRHAVTAADLQQFPIVGFMPGSARAAIDAWLQERPGLQLHYVAFGDTSLTIKAMALARHALAFVVESAVLDDVRHGHLTILTLPDFQVSYDLFAIHRGRELLSPAANAYLDELLALGRPAQAGAEPVLPPLEQQ